MMELRNMFFSRRLAILLVAGFVTFSAWSAEKPVRVAVFDDMGPRIRAKATVVAAQKALMQVLAEMPDVDAEYVLDLAAETLDRFDVLVLCQTGYPEFYQPADWARQVRQWVEAGHGLYVTHDAVGYRKFPAIFPDISKGVNHAYDDRKPFARQWCVAREHPVSDGFNLEDRFRISFYDTVTMDPGKNGVVVIRCVDKGEENELGIAALSGAPALVIGEPGKGRYVANGTCIGMLAPDALVFKPVDGELKLFKNCILWLGKRGAHVEPGKDIGKGVYLGLMSDCPSVVSRMREGKESPSVRLGPDPGVPCHP